MTIASIITLSTVFLLLEIVHFGKSGDVTYSIDIDEIMSCPDFKNDKIKTDKITIGLISDSDNGRLGMNGPLEIFAPIDDQDEISLEVNKETEVGSERLFTVIQGICVSLTDTNAPWYPVTSAMNMKECPIVEGSYMMHNVTMDMGGMDQFKSKDFCNVYQVVLKVQTATLEVKSCFVLQVQVSENKAD